MSVVDALIPWVTRILTAGGGWALGAVMFAENVFPPIPSEAVLPLAGCSPRDWTSWVSSSSMRAASRARAQSTSPVL